VYELLNKLVDELRQQVRVLRAQVDQKDDDLAAALRERLACEKHYHFHH
jgi:hypothetical protein